MQKTHAIESTVAQVPFDTLLKEGESQRNRILKEVMEALFSRLPTSTNHSHDFTLESGTKCWVKAFHAPKKDTENSWIYGFDVKLEEGSALSHLEFSVRCSGWERALPAPTP